VSGGGVDTAAPREPSTTVLLSEAIEAYLVEKYGNPPLIPASEKADVNLDLWLAIHGDVRR
jgi:glutathione S-transferase